MGFLQITIYLFRYKFRTVFQWKKNFLSTQYLLYWGIHSPNLVIVTGDYPEEHANGDKKLCYSPWNFLEFLTPNCVKREKNSQLLKTLEKICCPVLNRHSCTVRIRLWGRYKTGRRRSVRGGRVHVLARGGGHRIMETMKCLTPSDRSRQGPTVKQHPSQSSTVTTL